MCWCRAQYLTLTFCPAVGISLNWAFSVTALPFFQIHIDILAFDNVRGAFLYERLSYRSIYLFLVPYLRNWRSVIYCLITKLVTMLWVVGSKQHSTKHEFEKFWEFCIVIECSLSRFTPISDVQAGEDVPHLSSDQWEMCTCGLMWIVLVLGLFSLHCANLHRDHQPYFSWTFVAVWTGWTAALGRGNSERHYLALKYGPTNLCNEFPSLKKAPFFFLNCLEVIWSQNSACQLKIYLAISC